MPGPTTNPRPTPGVPSPDEVVRWGLALVNELMRAPGTIRTARRTLRDLGRLPDQLDALVAALDQTTGAIDRALPKLAGDVTGMDSRLEHMDTVVTSFDDRLGELHAVVADLSSTLTGVLGAIPGVRRSVRRTAG